MLIKDFQVGELQTNCYIVTDENTLETAIIDPGAEASVILNYVEENKLKPKYVFLTHGHGDHTGAAVAVSEATGAELYIHAGDVDKGGFAHYLFNPPESVKHYVDGDKFTVGGLEFTVMETPGHSAGSVCLICENALFCGDTLFRDSCGRTDLYGGSMRTLLRSLCRLHDLPGDYEAYPGHADSTTLERERRFNYYMKYAMENMKE